MRGEVYQPSPDVVRRMAQVDFVAVIGPSAVGKTTLIRAATAREFAVRLVLNNTSREPRPDEREGVDYRFRTRAEMEERITRREYVQVAPTVFVDLYATAAEDYPTEGVAVLPVLASTVPAFRSLPFGRMRTVYVLPPDPQTWHTRFERRALANDVLAKRLVEAMESLRFALADDSLVFVINDDLAEAARLRCSGVAPAMATTAAARAVSGSVGRRRVARRGPADARWRTRYHHLSSRL